MLYIQITIILVLIFILIALYLDERQKRKKSVPTGRVTQIWNGAERRRSVRVTSDIPIRYNLPSNQKEFKASRTKNISTGGACTVLNEKLSSGTKLIAEISLPNHRPPVILTAQVVWTSEETTQPDPSGIRHFNVGIEFINISPRDRDRLRTFIDKTQESQRGKD